MTRFSFAAFRVAAAVILGVGCAHASGSAQAGPAPDQPTLVVMLTVDQLRGDMLTRFGPELRGGFVRLKRGAWFVNAYQDHALTETAPGHASTLSGRFPRSTGIVSNSEGVGDSDHPLLLGLPREPGASPFRFHGTTLFDWLKARDARTRAFSVSMKDRGAILPIGRAREQVYWYSAGGAFTTSSYYNDSLPAWVIAFNDRRIPHSYAGSEWRLSRDTSTYREPDFVSYERGGRNPVFPHRFPADSDAAASVVRATPTMDSLTAVFALEGLRQTGIGRGPQTDVLAVSFSALDVIGHSFGPDSREYHEALLRLDETLGWFLDSLFAMRDSTRVVVALTGDHGVQPIPQLARDRGEARGNQGLIVSLSEQVTQVRAALRAAGVDTSAFVYHGEMVELDRSRLGKVNADSLLDAFARMVRRVPGVARVDRMSDIRKANLSSDAIARRWSHQIPDTSSIDLVMTLTRFSFWYPIAATHGSPYDQDAHVPIMFYGTGIKPGRYGTFVRTVDIAPTLAQVLGVQPLEPLDGVVLRQALR
jgi:predicted AlkP superfamily pyrophosphatase or phosphodiesterase